VPGVRAGFETTILEGRVDGRGSGAGASLLGNAGGQPEAVSAREKIGTARILPAEKKKHEKSRMSLFWDPFSDPFASVTLSRRISQ